MPSNSFNAQIFDSIEKEYARLKPKLGPRKIVKVSTLKMVVFERISQNFRGGSFAAVMLRKLKKKEKVYRYFETILRETMQDIFGDGDIYKMNVIL